jgi:hypothetical protein
MGAIVVTAVIPYLRILVGGQLDGGVDDPQARHLRQNLGATRGERGNVIGLFEDVGRE